MTTQLLVAYATKHGSTREVAATVADELRRHGFAVDLRPAADLAGLAGYDGVVIGSAIYMGRLHADARRFLHRHRHSLREIPFAVFAMGPRTLVPDDVASSRGQLEKALDHEPELEPVATAIFGGVLDPAVQHFPLNRMAASDARDWEAIVGWAGEVALQFSAVPAHAA